MYINFSFADTNPDLSWFQSSLITSNKSGDLQLWNLQSQKSNSKGSLSPVRYKFKDTKRRWQQRSVVSFAVCQSLVWTISSNREITLEDISKNNIKLQYGCVSTNIGALRECPDDMNKCVVIFLSYNIIYIICFALIFIYFRIALGFSDRRIGIIDISKMSPNLVHIDNFIHKIESSVTSLAWSPDCKKLAYGTYEGRVCFI